MGVGGDWGQQRGRATARRGLQHDVAAAVGHGKPAAGEGDHAVGVGLRGGLIGIVRGVILGLVGHQVGYGRHGADAQVEPDYLAQIARVRAACAGRIKDIQDELCPLGFLSAQAECAVELPAAVEGEALEPCGLAAPDRAERGQAADDPRLDSALEAADGARVTEVNMAACPVNKARPGADPAVPRAGLSDVKAARGAEGQAVRVVQAAHDDLEAGLSVCRCRQQRGRQGEREQGERRQGAVRFGEGPLGRNLHVINLSSLKPEGEAGLPFLRVLLGCVR